MGERLDVRRMLLCRGWTEHRHGVFRKGRAVWAVGNDSGDSFLDVPSRRGTHVVEFPNGVPARVVVAACEEAARG